MSDNSYAWLLGIPVLVPFVGAALTLLLARHYLAQRIVSLGALSIVLATAGAIIWRTLQGPVVLDVGGWAAPIGITLVADRLNALMLTVSVLVTLCVMIYSSSEGFEDDRVPMAVYHPTFLIMSAGVSNAFLTGDLFNLYVGFEILLVASFVLIMLGGTRERLRSGTVYVVVSLVSSAVFLIGLAMTYAATGSVNIAQLAIRLPQINQGTAMLIQAVLLIAFGVKAAVFPLSAWLPDSYPTAPAPVTAVFAGLLTKVGIYAIIRTQTTIFADSALNPWLQALALATMLIGILGAVAQNDIKRVLSFTLVSHIGFMLWGLSTGNTGGLGAAVFYTAHHIIVQTALFLVCGLMDRVGGSTSLVKLGGMLKSWPLLAALYLVPALNLAGVPPLSGFLGKVGLIEASVSAGGIVNYALIATGLITSLLTLYALIRAWNMAFWQPVADDEPTPARQSVPASMTAATIAVVVASLALTLFAAPIYRFASGAASELTARSVYIDAVLTSQRNDKSKTEPGRGPVPSATNSAPLPTPSRVRPSASQAPSRIPPSASTTPTGGR